MISIVKVISTSIDKLFRRVVKHQRNGKDDIQDSLFAAPFGIDSNPPPDKRAVYCKTGEEGKEVIIGYINVNSKAGIGELRLFSTDDNNEEKMFLWLKNNGTMELGGNTKNMTRFQELEAGFNQLRDDFNAHLDAFNLHQHSGVTSGVAASGAPIFPESHSIADISGAKIDEIKTL